MPAPYRPGPLAAPPMTQRLLPFLLPLFFLSGGACGLALGLGHGQAQSQALQAQDQALTKDIRLLHQASQDLEACNLQAQGLAQALYAQQESIASAPGVISQGSCWTTPSQRTFCYRDGAIQPQLSPQPQEPKP